VVPAHGAVLPVVSESLPAGNGSVLFRADPLKISPEAPAELAGRADAP